jgi:hypothetical protein
MHTLIEHLTQALSVRGIEQAGASIGALGAQIEGLRDERARRAGRVGWLERAVFFADLGAQVEVTELTEAIARRRAERAEMLAAHRVSLARVGQDFPVFALVMRTQELIDATRQLVFDDDGRLRARFDAGHLTGLIARYTDAVIATWAPGFDPGGLAALARDEAAARALAGSAPRVEATAHPTHLVAPLSGDELMALSARRLVEAGFYTRYDALSEWGDEIASYQRMLMSEQVHASVHAHAPMALMGAAHMLLGAAQALGTREQILLGPGGVPFTRDVPTPLAPLLVATHRLVVGLEQGFGEVLEVCERALGPIEALIDVARDDGFGDYHDALSGSDAPGHVEAMCVHASVLGWVSDERRRTNARITEIDRLVFWRDTPDEERFGELTAQRKAHGVMLGRHARAFDACAAGCVAQSDRLELRERIESLVAALTRVSTDPGSVPSGFTCRVHGRQDARAHITRARELLCSRFGVTWERDALIEHTARAIATGQAPGGPGASESRLVMALAERLGPTSFSRGLEVRGELVERAGELVGLIEQAARRVAGLTTAQAYRGSQEQLRLEELRAERAEIEDTLAQMGYVDQGFDEALFVLDPPTWMRCALDGLSEALEGLYAECRFERFRREEYDYACVLVGGEEFSARTRALLRGYRAAWARTPPAFWLATRWAVGYMHAVGDTP